MVTMRSSLPASTRRTWIALAAGLVVLAAAAGLGVVKPWQRSTAPAATAALKPQAAALVADAQSAASQGDYSRATQLLYRALDTQGPHPQLYGRLAIFFLDWSTRDHDPMLVASAENNFFLALQMNPRDEELWRHVDEGVRRGFFYRYDWERVRRRR